LTEGHGSLELLNRAGSERAGTQFVLSPRHDTVVSYAIFLRRKKAGITADSDCFFFFGYFFIKKTAQNYKKAGITADFE
jgi:hypothetical protein